MGEGRGRTYSKGKIFLFLVVLLVELKYIVVVACRRLPPRSHEATLGSGAVAASVARLARIGRGSEEGLGKWLPFGAERCDLG